MWRLRLQVAIAALLGLTIALVALGSSPPQAATADTTQATSTPTNGVSFNLNVIVINKLCPIGVWDVVNANSPSSAFKLDIRSSTQFNNGSCNDVQTGETVNVLALVPTTTPPGQPVVLIALSVQRYATPQASSVVAIDFRGTLSDERGGTLPGSTLMLFRTEVSGDIFVTVPATVLATLPLSRPAGTKADVRAIRDGELWIAQRIQFITQSNEIGFSGLIEHIPLPGPVGGWRIAGRTVYVTNPSVVKGAYALYRRATVTARLNGANIEATEIKIDETDVLALSFEIIGRGGFDREPYNNKSKIGGCIAHYVSQSVSTPANGWFSLNGVTIKVSGSRQPGIGARLTVDRIEPQSTAYGQQEVELQGYVDSAGDDPNGEDVRLQIAGVVIQANKASVANAAQVVTGAVIRIHGTCGSQENQVRATSITILSTQRVTFEGQIVAPVERDDFFNESYTLRPHGRNDTQRLLFRQNQSSLIGSGTPQEGKCIEGTGFYLQDGSIQIHRVEVVACSPAAFAPPTATPGVHAVVPPDDSASPDVHRVQLTPTPRSSEGGVAPLSVD